MNLMSVITVRQITCCHAGDSDFFNCMIMAFIWCFLFASVQYYNPSRDMLLLCWHTLLVVIPTSRLDSPLIVELFPWSFCLSESFYPLQSLINAPYIPAYNPFNLINLLKTNGHWVMHTPENDTRSLFTQLSQCLNHHVQLSFNKGNGVLALIRFVTVGLLEPQRWTGLL